MCVDISVYTVTGAYVIRGHGCVSRVSSKNGAAPDAPAGGVVGRRPSAVSGSDPAGMFTRNSPTLRRPWYGVECRDGCRGSGLLM